MQQAHLVKRLAVLATLAVLGGCAATAGQSLAIPTQHVDLAREPPGPLTATLVPPEGTGPFPVVILLHGCGGVSPGSWTWVRRLRGWGYATLILDSLSPRGVTTVCAPDKQPLVTPRDRAGDVLSAALYLQTLPTIDGSRIAVLGQSHGGATAARVTDQRYETLHPGLLKAAIDYYGPCSGAPEAHGTVPLLVLAGEDDNWGFPARSCRAYIAKLRPDQPTELQTYPGVVHAFDNPNQPFTTILGHNMGYDEGAADDSYQRVRRFLATWLAPAPHAP